MIKKFRLHALKVVIYAQIMELHDWNTKIHTPKIHDETYKFITMYGKKLMKWDTFKGGPEPSKLLYYSPL